MKKPVIIISIILAAAVLIWAGYFAWHNLRGAGPAFRSPPRDIAKTPESTPAVALLPWSNLPPLT
jgi:hypothetical protein